MASARIAPCPLNMRVPTFTQPRRNRDGVVLTSLPGQGRQSFLQSVRGSLLQQFGAQRVESFCSDSWVAGTFCRTTCSINNKP